MSAETGPDWTTPAPKAPVDGRLVRVRLRYTNGAKHTPWKRHAVCVCGWNLLSWDWVRAMDHVDDHIRARHGVTPSPEVQAILALCSQHSRFVRGCEECIARRNAAVHLLADSTNSIANLLGLTP